MRKRKEAKRKRERERERWKRESLVTKIIAVAKVFSVKANFSEMSVGINEYLM